MKKTRYTDSQIMGILEQAENGLPVADLCREHGMSNTAFYKWRARYGGMDTSLMSQMKELEKKKQLKRMYAEAQMKADLVPFINLFRILMMNGNSRITLTFESTL